jgi:hypothetical protein
MIRKNILLLWALLLTPMLLIAVPIAPSNKNFYPLSSTAVSLNWSDNSSTEQGFKIFRDGVLIHITKENETHFTDTGLQPNTSYDYVVAATDIARFKVIPTEGKIYFGSTPGFASEDNLDNPQNPAAGPANTTAGLIIDAFDIKAQKKTAWTYFANNWGRDGLVYPQDNVNLVLSKHKIPFIRLMPIKNQGVDPMGEDATYDPNKTYVLQDIISHQYDDELNAWAQAAKTHFLEKKAAGEPFYLMLDFAPEMNGYWFQWGGTHQLAATYKAAYRYIIDIFRANKVPHVTWVFHPDLPEMDWYDGSNPWSDFPATASASSWKYKDYTTWAYPALYYPGDDYIDWIGFSLYGKDSPMNSADSGYPSFAQKLQNLIYLEAIPSSKPFLVAEFATIEHFSDTEAKGRWLSNAFLAIRSKPRIKAITYWNESWWYDAVGSQLVNMDINSSSATLRAFREAIKDSKFINQVYIFNQE